MYQRTTPGRAVAHLIGGPQDGKVIALQDHLAGRPLLVPIIERLGVVSVRGAYDAYPDPYMRELHYRTGSYEMLAQSRQNPNVLVYEWVG